MRKFRIAIFHNLPSGGGKRALCEWTRRLALSHKIDVYTLSCANHEYADLRPFVNEHHIYRFTARKQYRSPLGRLNYLQRFLDLGNLITLHRQMAENINQQSYDMVFTNACKFTFIPPLLRYIDAPSFYYLHEPFGIQFTRQISRPYLNNKKWRTLLDKVDPLLILYSHRLVSTQMASVQTTKFLANSNFTSTQMHSVFGLIAPVCYYGVDNQSFFPLQSAQKKNCVISVGELTPRKGFDFLINSLALIPSDVRPTLRLACNYVDPDERIFIENLAARNQVQLEIFSHLNTDELRFHYNEATLCVYSPVFEPFGLVPLESMACGTPVVGVREGGVVESILDRYTGRLVERDPRMFADTITELLLNPKKRNEYRENCVQYINSNWSWEKSAANLEEYMNLWIESLN